VAINNRFYAADQGVETVKEAPRLQFTRKATLDFLNGKTETIKGDEGRKLENELESGACALHVQFRGPESCRLFCSFSNRVNVRAGNSGRKLLNA
jgi:hypothetical protein